MRTFPLVLATALVSVAGGYQLHDLNVEARQKAQGTIIVDAARSQLHLGGTVYFTVTTETPKTGSPPSIEIDCYRGDGALIFSTAGYADGRGFVLGGDNSPWKTTGGPAHCHTDLYQWSQNGKQRILLDPDGTEFDAAGAP